MARKIAMLVIPVVLLCFIDQLTKYLAVTFLKDNSPKVIIENVFQLQYLENHGAAFGILQGHQVFFYIITIAIVAVLTFLYFRIPETRRMLLLRLICIFIISGAIGNLIDRAINHYVVDFLYFSLINFPIFNVADIYVTGGAIAFIISLLFIYKDEDMRLIFPRQKSDDA